MASDQSEPKKKRRRSRSRGGYNSWLSQITTLPRPVSNVEKPAQQHDDKHCQSSQSLASTSSAGSIKRGPYNAEFIEPTTSKIPRSTEWSWKNKRAHDDRPAAVPVPIAPPVDSVSTPDHDGDDALDELIDVDNDNPNNPVNAVNNDNNIIDSDSSSSNPEYDTIVTVPSSSTDPTEMLMSNSNDSNEDELEGSPDNQQSSIAIDIEHAETEREECEPAEDPSDRKDADDDCGYGTSSRSCDDTTSYDNYDDIDSQPIYKGSRITVAVHMLLLMTFAVRHSLSSAAIVDLLALIELHCLGNNLCQTSLRMFHGYFDNMKTPVEKHYYCMNGDCSTYFGKCQIQICTICKKEQTKQTYFFISPLAGALQAIFDRPAILTHLQYPQKRVKQHKDNIEDVYDGRVYQERFDKDGYFKGTPQEQKGKEIHLSLQMNTDGVSLFKSSKYSVWPVFFVINELHPKLRYSRQFRLLGGMWFGQNKPKFQTFMKPFADMINNLYREGIDIALPNGTKKKVRALVLDAVFDSPARCVFQNFSQFNGKHGCPFCTTQGESVKTSEQGSTQTYPFDLNSPETGHGDKRTHQQTMTYADEAETGTSKNRKPVMGVKGRSAFMDVESFDIIRCVAPDYMHGVMLGVVKMLLNLWFDSAHSSSKWSIRKKVKEVDARLTAIKPPSIISRPPQSIGTHIKWWKASEFRSFLLFYSVPCLYGIMPTLYFNHLMLLVNAMHILLGNSISAKGLQQARLMLRAFVFQIRELYHPRYFTWNLHSLLHYVNSVEDLGPLFLLSCFWFEDFNGDLRNQFHGTRGVEFQVLTAVAISQKLPVLANQLTYGTVSFELYEHMTKTAKSCKLKISEMISDTVGIVGLLTGVPDEYSGFVSNIYGELTECTMFQRMLFCGRVIQSKLYTRTTKQNNYTILYKYGEELHFGNVITFVRCKRSCTNIVVCNKYCSCHSIMYLAIIQHLHVCNNIIFSETLSVDKLTKQYIVPVEGKERVVVPVNKIIMQCVLMEVGQNAFVGMFPNTHEKD